MRLLAIALVVATAGTAWAQAEPAPPGYVPPGHHAPLEPAPEPGEPGAPPSLPAEPPPKWHVSVGPRMPVFLGEPPKDLPRVGYGGGVSLSRALVPLGRRLRFGVGFDFGYDRIFRDLTAPKGASQYVTHATFAVVGVFDALIGRLRPYVGIGGGLSVATYSDPSDSPPDNLVSAIGLVHLTAGLGVRLWESFELGLHGEWNLTFSTAEVGSPPRTPLSPGLFVLGLDAGFRF